MKRRIRFAEGDLVKKDAPQNRTIDDMSFSEAFKTMRKELGEDKTFTWRGEKYTTSIKTAPKRLSLPSDRATNFKGVSTPEERQKFTDSAVGVVEKAMKAAGIPLHYRAFAGTMLGSKSKITEDYLTPDELAKLKIRTEKAASEGRSSIDYGKNKENINPVLNESPQFGRGKDIELTFGRAGFTKNKGKTVLRDAYDFDNSERRPELDRLKKIREKDGEFAIYKDVANKTVNDLRREGLGTVINRLPSRLGNAFIGEDGRPVEITMRRGGRVKEERVRGYGIAQKGHGRGRFVR